MPATLLPRNLDSTLNATTIMTVRRFFLTATDHYSYKSFRPPSNKEIEFFVRIYPRSILFPGKTDETEEIMMLLKMNRMNHTQLTVHYSVEIIDDKGNTRFEKGMKLLSEF